MRILDPEEALRIWGLRQYGELRSAGPRQSKGGPAGVDYDTLTMLKVEQFFNGPERTMFRGIAVWVFVLGNAPGEFPWRFPGETKTHALLRHAWFRLEDSGLPPTPSQVHTALLNSFREWWGLNGVIFVPESPDQGEEEIAALEERDRARILNSSQAAQMLGRSPNAVANLLDRGRLRGAKVHGRWETTLGDVWDFQEKTNAKRLSRCPK